MYNFAFGKNEYEARSQQWLPGFFIGRTADRRARHPARQSKSLAIVRGLFVSEASMSQQAMQKHIGTKVVNLLPMTRGEYNAFRGWELPSDENGSDDGYLVEYLDGGQPNTPHYAGYVSWSPKAQADAAYRSTSAMTFGDALIMLKAGQRVARSGWNGKGMWLAYTPGSEFATEHAKPGHAAAHRAAEAPSEPVRLLPHIDMRAADGSMVIGWLASQTDMLAEDWQIV